MTMRLNDHGGLACTGTTWILFALVVIAWLVGPSLALVRRGGWRAMPASLLGYVWLGFAIDFVVRFLLLTVDSVEFGNDTFRLADLPASTVDHALLLSLVYWACIVLGFALWGRLRSPGLLGAIGVLGGEGSARRRTALLVGTTACFLLSVGPFGVPLALVTPLGIAGSLWVIPAAATWADFVAGATERTTDPRSRWLALTPALVRFLVSPYREHLVPIVLIPTLVWWCARGRLPRRQVMVAAVALPLFVLSGSVTQAYRDVLWGGAPIGHVAEGVTGPDDDMIVEPDPGWLVAIRRFHGLDSLLLTIDLVPSAFPFRDEPILTDAFVRGLVPRALLPSKALSDRGPEFARTIWAFDSGVDSEAAIAPSMPGDLYHGGGAYTVALGALVWGLLLGLVDRWKDALPVSGRAAVLVLFATQVVPSVERDFEHCVATLLQTLVVIALSGGVLSQMWRRGRPAPLAAGVPELVA